MKRKISTTVLFVLLILTVVAITQTDMPPSDSARVTGAVKHETN